MDRQGKQAVRVAKALSDPTRYELLRRIAQAGEINCRDLTTLFPVSQATVSHHLKILIDAGLVRARREGQFHYYSVRPGALEGHADALARSFARPGSRGRQGRAT
ncbi:MAG TPA: metalloregulator ArsR/SmtB family transcription factor [Anaeromyxobacteraceae bacterium]|nr:metalloregulator ArsR/SmtB family transcription factor [Anaeromyxobacteraceae bacterium]